jgi:cytochrome c-type biogenesis protein CcmE
LFREGQGIVANGILANGNIIEASEVLAKHDENYMPRELLDDADEKPVISSYSKNILETTY